MVRIRAHALALLAVLALVAPARPVVGAYPGVAQAELAQTAGAQQTPQANAPRALLVDALDALDDAQTDAAEALVQRVLAEYPSWDGTADAYMTLAAIRRAADDCAGALRALDAFDAAPNRSAVGPYAQVLRAQCAATLGDWPTELAAAQAGLAIEGGGPRLTRIELFERAASALLKMDRPADALSYDNRALELAGTQAYRAEMLYTTASLARDLGQSALAAERFRAIVVDLPQTARAAAALDALVDLGQATTVSPFQAETVRLKARDDTTAVALADQVDPISSDWGQARIGKAEALARLGRDADAEATLQAVADAGSPDACAALIALGRLQQRAGNTSAAELSYLRATQTTSDQVPAAWFGVGFLRFLRGANDDAIAAWGTGLGTGPPTPQLQSLLLYWIGKASADGRPAYEAAVRAAPETYHGLRAAEQLGGSLRIASAPSASSTWLSLTSSEIAERDRWYGSLGLTSEKVDADIAANPGIRRAATLLGLGLRVDATWELDGVGQAYVSARDVAHLNGLADWLTAHGLPQLTLRVGKQMRELVGLAALPRAAQKQVYPVAYGDLVVQQASAQGVDPLLVLSLVRQESSFDAHAQSSAQAMGLTQVVPSTARGIAAQLDLPDFQLRDLFKPAISLQFGSWYLKQVLTQFDGRLFPALAAYNSGGGNVRRWLNQFGDDPDVLMEQVPYAETQAYLRTVYDNYWHYRALYGGS